MKPQIATLLILTHCLANAQGEYAISKIPPAMFKNADVVKRSELLRFDIKDIGSATLYHKYALTILNEAGDKEAGITQWYDGFHTIKYIDANLYDADGKKIKSLKKQDISDYSAVGENFADDSRTKSFQFNHKIYPYTVEYMVEKKNDELMFMPQWLPQQTEAYSVEQSSFEVSMPADYTIRHKAFNYPAGPTITNSNGKKIYNWSVKNMEAMAYEYASPEWQTLTTTVLLGATQFKIDKYQGSMTNWQDFGKFVYTLNQDRDVLPQNIKQMVHTIADGVANPKQKIELLYKYMQQNTRYVSMQLGIGGWQPLDADFVSKKGYGDCKALSNYMYALLKEAGIPAHTTDIKAGENNRSFIEDFPSSQFNHVILCVPLPPDTMWLECTSQTLPAGYLSGFTSSRPALIIAEDGGHLVHTPHYKMSDNQQLRNIKATLNEQGQLTAKITTNYTGLQQDDIFSIIHQLSKEKQLEAIKSGINMGTFDIQNFNYQQLPTAIPTIVESIELLADSYAQASGKRIFITPNILNRSSIKLNDAPRVSDINLKNEYRDIDSVDIIIPAGFVAEAMPQNTNISTKFGNYSSAYALAGNRIAYHRKMEMKSGLFSKTDYKELCSFYEAVYKADRSRMVLVKKED